MKELNDTIKRTLDNIDEDFYPKINRMIKTESGYDYVKESMINMMIDSRMSASATLYHIENMI